MELTFKHSTYIIPKIFKNISCKDGNLYDPDGNIIKTLKNIPNSKYINLNCNYKKKASTATICFNINLQEINRMYNNNIIIPDEESILQTIKDSKILKKNTTLSVLDYINYYHIYTNTIDSTEIHNIKKMLDIENKILLKKNCYSNYKGSVVINQQNNNIKNTLALCELDNKLHKNLIITDNYSLWKHYIKMLKYCPRYKTIHNYDTLITTQKYIFIEPKYVKKYKSILSTIIWKRIIFDCDHYIIMDTIYRITSDMKWYLFKNENTYNKYTELKGLIIEKKNKINNVLYDYLVVNNFSSIFQKEKLIIVPPYKWEVPFIRNNTELSIKEQIIEYFNKLNKFYFYNLYYISYDNQTNSNIESTCNCQNECCICFEKNNIKSVSLKCSHSFCFVCTIKILMNNFNCPLCRCKISHSEPGICFNNQDSNKEILNYKLGSKITSVFQYILHCKYNDIIIVTNFTSIKNYLEKSKLLNYLILKTNKNVKTDSMQEFTQNKNITSGLIIFLEPYFIINNVIVSKKNVYSYINGKNIDILFFIYDNLFEKTILENII